MEGRGLVAGGVDNDITIDLVGRTLRVRGERRTERKADAIVNEIAYGQLWGWPV
jgi:HSP20 family molecular chaperone IbpA